MGGRTMYQIGEIISNGKDVILNEGRRTQELIVSNLGDRAIQVGSHYHFFEVNKALRFDREKAFGMHLDIPAGTAVRFEPGEEKKVTVVEYAGDRIMRGFNGLTNGPVEQEEVKEAAIRRAIEKGFI
jgi:urease beta subunit